MLLIIIVLFGAMNIAALDAETGSENSREISSGLKLLPDNAPPYQPVLLQPSDNSTNVSTSPTLQLTVSDPDAADNLDVNFYGRPQDGGSGEDFTLVLIPDPQNASQYFPQVFNSMTNWIASQQDARNIVFVTTLGDMVNNASSTAEYINADAAMDILDPADIPYSVGAGNHDEPTTNFNIYFGISRFSGKPWYGGHYGSNNDNSYSFFSASGMDFILINLVYNPSAGVLDWADAILKANSGRRAIVESHSVLNFDNSWTNQSIYTALKDNPNLFLILCGHTHDSDDGAAYRSELGDDGHTIHIMHADYQDYPNGGNGYLRILRFSPSADRIYGTTYSPYSGTSLTTYPDQMEMVYDMEDVSGGAYTLIGTVNNVDNGASASVSWPGRSVSTGYEWYATVSDGTEMVTSATWSFTTSSIVSYNLTVNLAGNGSVSKIPNKAQYNSGEVVQLTANADPGWKFSSWSGDLTGSVTPRSVTMNGNKIITATFIPECIPPSIPIVGTITQPSCESATGSVVLSGLPEGDWTINPGAITGSVTSTAITGLNSGTFNFTVTSEAECTSAATTNVVINEQPMPPARPGPVTGNTTVCQGNSQTYSVALVTGATSYSWTLPSGWSGSSGSNSITAIAGANDGNISVTANNACGSSTARSLNVTVQSIPSQPGAISGNTTVCQGATRTYSISAVNDATSYTWTLPSGWTGSSGSTSINATAGASGGIISVTANNSCGTSTARNLNVTVQTTPGQPGVIAGNTAVCQGTTQTYSIAAVAGATEYAWILPSGWSGNSGSTSITATAGATSGNISVTANNSCGPGTSRTLGVTVTALPGQPGTITGDATVCQGVSETYSIALVSGATSYSWTLPSGWSGSSGSNSITATAGANDGNISVTANNTCGSSTARSLNVTVQSIPSQPGAISGNATVCQGVAQTYSIAAVPGATSYTWTLPTGWSGSSNSRSITATAGANNGNISVAAKNPCGTSTIRNLNVTVQTIPSQPVEIAGNTSICEGTFQTYSIAVVTGATSYTWTLPSGWSGSSNSTSITVTAGAISGNISVTANNSCGSGIARILSVTTTPLPGQPGTITGDATVCQGVSETYSIALVSGATSYSWTLPSGWSGSSGSTSITATAGVSSGNISVSATNACSSSTARNLNVTVQSIPSQPGEIGGNTTVCQGVAQTYSIAAVPGATSYTWTLPTGWSGSSNSTSITATAGANNGNISVAANNACGTSTLRNLNVTVQTIPSQPVAIEGNSSVCMGTSQTYSITAVAGATSYTWTLPSGWSGSSNSTSISAITGVNGGNISVTAINSCGSGTSRTLGVTVTVIPQPTGAITGVSSVCPGSAQTYMVSSVPGATSYTWTLPTGWSGSSVSTSINATAGENSGNISVTANNTCGISTARSLFAAVQTVPSQPGAIGGNTTVCQGVAQTYSIADVTGATSYTWTLPSGWSGSSNSTSITPIPGAEGGTISVSANNSCGSGTLQTLDIAISGIPIITITHIKGISTSTADVAGELVYDGGTDVLERGVCWSISANPTMDDSRTSDGTSAGPFTSTMTGLSTGVLYHVRSYATNCSGTGYGSDIKYLHIPTGIDLIQDDGICVFPNPFTGILNIEYNNDNITTINIFNSSGVQVRKEQAITPRQQLDFSRFEYGIYILEFVSPAGEISRVKVIKLK